MSPVKLEISFDDPSATYYSGAYVAGRILVRTRTLQEFKGLYICLKGFADVLWNETKTDSTVQNDDPSTSSYMGHEDYFSNKLLVLGSDKEGRIILPAGEYSYPFQMVLPPNLPSSFVGSAGYVRYEVEGVLSRPCKSDNKCVAVFTVLSPLDLDLYPEAQNPVQLTKEKSYSCCCIFSKGQSSLTVSLPRSAFSPHQEIPITIEIDNRSSMDISDIVCTLKKNMVYRAERRATKKETIDVASVGVGSVSQMSSKTWTKSLLIPELPPDNLTRCKIIDLDYTICIVAKTPAFHNNIAMTIPLVIGTSSTKDYNGRIMLPCGKN